MSVPIPPDCCTSGAPLNSCQLARANPAQIMDHRHFPVAGRVMSSQEKRLAGEAAIRYVEKGAVIGVGTGSTVAFFIDALADLRDQIQGAVSSSEQSTAQLKKYGIPVLDLNA